MNSLDDYGSDSCSESETTLKKQKTNPIPNIEPEIASNHLFKNTEITLNAPLIHIQKPTVGPLNPYSSANATNKNTLAGFFESHSMDDASFTTLQRTYQRDGYTLNPDGSGYIGDLFKAEANNGRVITEKNAAYVKPKRLPKGDPSSVDFLGPWAGYENEKIGLDPKQTEKQDEEIHVPIEAVVPSVF